MNNVIFCIILYNTKVSESKSITSIINNWNESCSNSKIIIFNNGDDIVEVNEIKEIKEINENIEIFQILINGSLSKIYNKCIQLNKGYNFVFLDDDTEVSKDYFNEVLNCSSDILLPRVVCNNLDVYPVFTKEGVQSITSGLYISSKLVSLLTNFESKVFDERFDLYGIDTAFFL
ncbi:hypothetical protein BTN98_08665 [Photobacterium aquimaris]|uniref:glycosyltransferase family 2 protein n=1 Tax=Photobacterium aquimaris TaxID=512643 RepID=UPI000CF53113|nr:glycosyltransferase family A protein [Photobacterium aquimaris]PQJ41673.1 hypothetical protein BTN98_08665 [Photobacterium aquimaris]